MIKFKDLTTGHCVLKSDDKGNISRVMIQKDEDGNLCIGSHKIPKDNKDVRNVFNCKYYANITEGIRIEKEKCNRMVTSIKKMEALMI
ncbi:hypothetical protein HOC11_02990 [archaeon]|nr:hypothetical protein [archaeon]